MGAWTSALQTAVKESRRNNRKKRYQHGVDEKIAQCYRHSKTLSRSDPIHHKLSSSSKVLKDIHIDSHGDQLTTSILTSIHRHATHLASLRIENYPTNCRVCVYALFRTLDFTQFQELTMLSLQRDYRDECYIRLVDVEFPTSLLKLYLEGLGLTAVPLNISNLSNLQVLSLANNVIAELNELLDNNNHKLGNLTELNLSQNRLSVISPELGTFLNLTLLDLSDNQIKLSLLNPLKLDKLEHVNLAWNRLADIPIGLMDHKNVKYIDMSHNKLTALPQNHAAPKIVLTDGNPVHDRKNTLLEHIVPIIHHPAPHKH